MAFLSVWRYCGVFLTLLLLSFLRTGRGEFSSVPFDKGDFLLEYRGQLISKPECDLREKFRFNGELLCVDATIEDGSLGRLVNDDNINPNSKMKTISVEGKPHLCLFATRNINPV